MKRTYNQEHIVGILCVAVGAVVLVLTKSFPGGTDAASISGPAFFPNLLSIILIALGVYEILHGVFGNQEEFASFGQIWHGMKSKEFVNLLIIAALLVVYIATVEVVGFYTMSTVFLFIVLWRLNVKLLKNLICTAIFLAVIYFVFSRIFAVSLPSGILV